MLQSRAHGVDLFSVNLLGHRQETSAQLEELRLTQDSGIPTMSLMRTAEDTHVRACTLYPGFISALSTLGSEMCLQAITNASDTENGNRESHRANEAWAAYERIPSTGCFQMFFQSSAEGAGVSSACQQCHSEELKQSRNLLDFTPS